MYPSDFYNDCKYCENCCQYVSYLQSMDQSYCVQCGEAVRLFSSDDWESFNASLKERRPKGGRPRKARQEQEAKEKEEAGESAGDQDKESA